MIYTQGHELVPGFYMLLDRPDLIHFFCVREDLYWGWYDFMSDKVYWNPPTNNPMAPRRRLSKLEYKIRRLDEKILQSS